MRLPDLKLFDLFYKFYHSWPRFYDNFTQLFSLGQWERWQNRVFEDLTGKKILEIGVGPGRLLINLLNKGYTLSGIELRKGMAYEARRRVKEKGYEVEILHRSVYSMPYENESFDCIIMTFVLAEIKDLDKAIIEMQRVLKKGGKIIVIAGGMPEDRNFFAKVLFKIVEPFTTLRMERDNKSYLEKYGFQVKRVDFGPFNIVNKLVAIKQ